MNLLPLLHPALALLLAPLLFGVINRTKAWFAGRHGQPLLQTYHDLWKLLRKGAVYSHTTTWLFRLGPLAGLAAVGLALFIAPLGPCAAPIDFSGDLLLFAYLLGLVRLLTVLAALDTGSSFEGMGASREVFFSALAEPALLIGLAVLARATGFFSLSAIYGAVTPGLWLHSGGALALIMIAIFVVLLVENARIPFDDPATHLELTMIHEVMVLDHSGPDFAFIIYGSSLKLWTLGSLLVGLAPLPPHGWALDALFRVCLMFLLAVIIGVVESTMARLRLVRVPQLLVGAGALAGLAMFLLLR